MKKRKAKRNKPTPLKDFDIVAHIVTLAEPTRLESGDDNYFVVAAYINRYGLQIGALLKDPKTNELRSFDPEMWDEHLWLEFENSQGATDDKN